MPVKLLFIIGINSFAPSGFSWLLHKFRVSNVVLTDSASANAVTPATSILLLPKFSALNVEFTFSIPASAFAPSTPILLISVLVVMKPWKNTKI